VNGEGDGKGATQKAFVRLYLYAAEYRFSYLEVAG
jgi:hypothetical protein